MYTNLSAVLNATYRHREICRVKHDFQQDSSKEQNSTKEKRTRKYVIKNNDTRINADENK